MTFYEEISTYYDYIFPINKTQLNFFKKQFEDNSVKSVLDIASGSGSYTLAFAEWGLQAVGIDFEEDMVKKASAKVKELTNVSFVTGDMRTLPFTDREFGSAICIGNSLPHILSDDDLEASVKEMYRILDKEGILILQTVNYDRILKHKVSELPLIENNEIGLVFRRLYDFREDGLLDFNTELEIKKDEGTKIFNNTVVLRPLNKLELERMLKEAGFTQITVYGAFDGREHSDEAPATVIVAKK